MCETLKQKENRNNNQTNKKYTTNRIMPFDDYYLMYLHTYYIYIHTLHYTMARVKRSTFI